MAERDGMIVLLQNGHQNGGGLLHSVPFLLRMGDLCPSICMIGIMIGIPRHSPFDNLSIAMYFCGGLHSQCWAVMARVIVAIVELLDLKLAPPNE